MRRALDAATDPPRCPACNYDLRGITGNFCPECGADVENAHRTVDGIDRLLRGIGLEISLDAVIGVFGLLAVYATRQLAVAAFFIAGIVGAFALGVRWVNALSARYGLVFRGRSKVLLHLIPGLVGALMSLMILLPILL